MSSIKNVSGLLKLAVSLVAFEPGDDAVVATAGALGLPCALFGGRRRERQHAERVH